MAFQKHTRQTRMLKNTYVKPKHPCETLKSSKQKHLRRTKTHMAFQKHTRQTKMIKNTNVKQKHLPPSSKLHPKWCCENQKNKNTFNTYVKPTVSKHTPEHVNCRVLAFAPFGDTPGIPHQSGPVEGRFVRQGHPAPISGAKRSGAKRNASLVSAPVAAIAQ